MSVVASIIQDGRIYMAGDSAVSDSDSIFVCREGKVFKWKNYLFGVVGSGRVANVVQCCFRPPGNIQDDKFTYVVGDFVESLRKAFEKEHVDTERDSKDEKHESFVMLLGYCGRVFMIDDSFQASEPVPNFFAVGAGGDYALGALHATAKMPWSPKTKLAKAIGAACAWSTSCREPITYEVL